MPVGGLDARRALKWVWLRLLAPLFGGEALVFAVLILTGSLDPLGGLIGLLALFALSTACLLPYARSLGALGRWVVGLEEDDASELPPLKGFAVDPLFPIVSREVHRQLESRERQIESLVAEAGRMLDALPEPILILSRARRIVTRQTTAVILGKVSSGTFHENCFTP